jgi:proteasome assembly chaperone 3
MAQEKTPDVREEAFPAPSRAVSGLIDNISTEIARVDFSDKILLTISQEGRLAQWVTPPRSRISNKT